MNLTEEQIRERIRGVAGDRTNRPALSFTRAELELALNLKQASAGTKIRQWMDTGTVIYACDFKQVNVRGHEYANACYVFASDYPHQFNGRACRIISKTNKGTEIETVDGRTRIVATSAISIAKEEPA